MNIKNASIATARIHGLKRGIYYSNDKCCYMFDITFSDSSTFLFDNLALINLTQERWNAQELYEMFQNNFNKANIYEDSKVAVLFDESGHVFAISKLGNNNDCWIDVEDMFTVKKFSELNTIIVSLNIH